MGKYEAMFIVKPDLAENDRKTLLHQISETITKEAGSASQASVWSEKRKFCFPINKYNEGVYLLVSFEISTQAIAKIRHTYKLNENILRVLISRLD